MTFTDRERQGNSFSIDVSILRHTHRLLIIKYSDLRLREESTIVLVTTL